MIVMEFLFNFYSTIYKIHSNQNATLIHEDFWQEELINIIPIKTILIIKTLFKTNAFNIISIFT